jgi:hypothetical protein
MMNNNIVIALPLNNKIDVIAEETRLTIINPSTNIVQVNTPGPQGPKSDLGLLPVKNSEPSNPEIGTLYYDTTLLKIRLFNGSQWINLSFE